MLELPISGSQTILDLWRDEITNLGAKHELEQLRCRIVVSHNAQPPQLNDSEREAGFSIERDPANLRGTGGVLADIARQYDDDAMLLVANASQLLLKPLHQTAGSLAERSADVCVSSSSDGVPSSIGLISCRALRDLPEIGFIDLKEQGLPLMAKRRSVAVSQQNRGNAKVVRTGKDYLDALRAYHAPGSPMATAGDAFSENWQSAFSIVEPGSSVGEGVVLHDSVVLAGGRIEPGAVVARSIVCGGTRVGEAANVIDRIVGKTHIHSLEVAGE